MAKKKKISILTVLGVLILAGVLVPHLYKGSAKPLITPQSTSKTSARKKVAISKNLSDIDLFYNDNFGSNPVAADFDTAPGEICGNGQSQYYRSKPPRKPIPADWVAPPVIGSDPSYRGPDPLSSIKESPYAMPAARQIFRRPQVAILKDPFFTEYVLSLTQNSKNKVVYASTSDIPDWLVRAIPTVIQKKATALSGSPSEAYAQLRKSGATHLIIDRTTPAPAPWIETEYDSLQIRLRENLPTPNFHPVLIGRNFIVYHLRATTRVSATDKNHITQYVRNRLKGTVVGFPEIQSIIQPVDGNDFRVIISLRGREYIKLKGRKIARRIGRGSSLQAALDISINRLKTDWNKTRQSVQKIYSQTIPADIQNAIDSLEISIEIFTEMAELTDRSLRRITHNMELGIDGLFIRNSGNLYYLEPSYALHRDRTTPYRFLLRLIQRSKLKQFLNTKDPRQTRIAGKWIHASDSPYGIFRTIHWVEETPGGAVIPLYRGFPYVDINNLDRATVAQAAKAGADWLVRHQSSDGQYGYKYEPFNRPSKRWTPGGNIVRHGLNPYTLLLVHSATPDPDYIQSAKNGIRYTLRFLRTQGGRCVICHRDVPAPYYNAKVGAVAVTILSILKLSEFDDISEFEPALACLAEEILYVQDPNGHFRQYDVPADHPYYGAESTIPPGQILMVLARLYAHTNDNRFLNAFKVSLPFYMKAWRHLVNKATDDGVYVDEDRANIIGIIPWMIMALNDLHAMEPDDEYVSIAFEMQDWMLTHLFYHERRSSFPDYLGAGFKSHKELPAINACQFTEGATALHSIARRAGTRVVETRHNALLGVRFCMQLQFRDSQSTFFLPEQHETLGGFRYHLGATRLRNDYSYHALASLAQAVAYIPAEEFPKHIPISLPEYFSIVQ